ncbi:glycoside hydrolase family 88/105 protein [Roseateles sp. P5_E7]
MDDMYMITALQVQAWRATGEPRYLDRAAQTLAAYLERLQQPNGLFFHTLEAPIHWGRGNGWVASGLTELLRELPASHALHKTILAGYLKMMRSLLAQQAPSGMWRQVIDRPASWEESSATAMFTFAFVTGVKQGLLPEAEFAAPARRAWLALVGQLTPEGDVREVCVGTGHSRDVAYCLARPRVVGDKHGQAPLLWTAAALLRA